MPGALIIANPVAGRRQGLPAAPAGARVVLTDGPGHARELAERAGLEGCATVVAAGGDGTVHEVAAGLMAVSAERRPALGVVPLGSGNDFAFACGLMGLPVEQALGRALQGEARPVDAAQISDDAGRSAFFVNSAGLLLDAAINMHSHRLRRLPGVRGLGIYLLATARAFCENYQRARVRLTLDGQTSEQELLLMTLGNGPREGGCFLCTPAARNDDGVLDYMTAAAPMSRLSMLRLLPAVMRGRHAGRRGVAMGRFQTLELESDRAVPIHLDGELWAAPERNVRRLSVRVLSGALRVRA